MSDVIIATESGHFVSQKWMFLAEMLQDYNHNLELRWIPTSERNPEDRDKPYVIVSKDKQGRDYIVMFASELDQPEEVMAKVFQADMKHGDVLSRMEARNTANKLFEYRKQEEELEEKRELSEWLIKTNKMNPTFRSTDGELIKLDGQLNRVNRKTHL